MEDKFSKKDMMEDLEKAHKMNMRVVLVEADLSRGFSYPYLLCLPENPQSTIVMDCLNDYEDGLQPNEIVNLSATEQVYNLFGSDRIVSSIKSDIGQSTEEIEAKSLERLYDRLVKNVYKIRSVTTKRI